MRKICSAIAAIIFVASGGIAVAEGPGDPTAVKKEDDGKWLDKDGNPAYKITDGTVAVSYTHLTLPTILRV